LPTKPITHVDFDALSERMGAEAFSKRLMMEALQESEDMKQSLLWVQTFHARIEFILKKLRLYERGRKNAHQIQLVHNVLHLQDLPAAFENFKILQLSDLHLDIDLSLQKSILDILKAVGYDLAVITGDFRCRTIADYYPAIEATKPIIEALNAPCFAVLGNHDPIEIVPHLEAYGLRFLLNELHPVYREQEVLWLVGIDDPHFYQTGDLKALSQQLPSGACSLLLAHSPEIAPLANDCHIQAALCGHTHGGQLCLPFGIPLSTNLPKGCPRKWVAGSWQYGSLQGYTSRGTGCCGVPVRFNCLPEITLHILKKMK
jgi:predicted MPP superfamily phosphohydrolase